MKDTQLILYEADDGQLKIQVRLEDETVWLNTHQMAELFDVDRTGIVKHIRNIYGTGELKQKSTCAKIAQVAKDGKKRQIDFYNLDMIISVGYRVNSIRGTQFRIWATQRLKEYIVKGFALDDERLKEGKRNPYFDELIERVREIRTSERNFYQKITDIYALSIDYDPYSKLTQNFFATVQNKMHFGIHGRTAAEIISERADSSKPNMGITCIEGRKIHKKDAFIANNYLTKEELQELNLIVDQYLSFAELRARNNRTMKMEDWIRKLDDFLRLNEKEILKNKGSVSKKLADEKAEKEFIKFKKEEDKKFISDFDKSVKKVIKFKK
ncbi:MAG: virulence RhuM family protein [Candidatus Peregrinibacteria bacterium]